MILRAIVRDVRDPASLGRIRVMIPQQSGGGSTGWIYPVVTSGYVVTPEVGDQVWVTFEGNDKEMPVWIGKAVETTGYKTLLQRVVDLEAEVASLRSRVSALEP